MSGDCNNYGGLSPKLFRRLSQLEEVVFRAIRDGRLDAWEYIHFIQVFTMTMWIDLVSRGTYKMDAKTAHAIIIAESKILARDLSCFDEDRAKEYFFEFRKFLEEKGIKIDFRKAPFR